MLPHNHLRKLSCLLGVALLGISCLDIAYADGTCSALSNSIAATGTGTYLRFAVPNAPTINFNVSLVDYSEMIDHALSNEPIGTIGIAACIAVSNANSASAAWNNSDLAADTLVKIEMNAPESSYKPPVPGIVDAIALSGPSGYKLAADYSFCPCSQYNSASSTCSGTGAHWAINSTSTLIMTNAFTPTGLSAGRCTDALGTGGLIFNIYSQADQIPYVGKYTANYSFGVAPDS